MRGFGDLPGLQPTGQAGLLTLVTPQAPAQGFHRVGLGGRDAHEVVADGQRITVPAMLTINDAVLMASDA
jgi:hypothetical protein